MKKAISIILTLSVFLSVFISFLTTASMRWSEAVTFCQSAGGHIVTVSNKQENDFIFETFCKPFYMDIALGLNDAEEEGVWKWVNSESFSYSNWDSGEPNDYNNNEDYVIMTKDNGKWNDYDLSGNDCRYLCEWDSAASVNATYLECLYYNGHYYKIYKNICNTWEEAKEYCEKKGGYLATITSQEENDKVFEYISNYGFQAAYIGLSCDSERKWSWVTGEDVFYTNWASGEPNNEDGTERYAEFYAKNNGGEWNDGNFDHGTGDDAKNFICEWGNVDFEQYSHVDLPDGKTMFDGHTYKVFDESVSWSNAKTYCERMGGHLVTINSQKEQDFLVILANSNTKTNYWIGAHPENGTFHWVTEEDFSYTNWASGEPNNVFGSQNAVMMYTKRASYPAGTWNDENENGRDWSGYELSAFGYICEWDDSISSERIITTGKKTNYYGALTYETSKAGEVQDAAIEFKEALELYFNAFCSEGQKRIGNTTGPVSLDELAKKLRKQDEAASDKYIKMSDGSIPSDCLDSIYYTLAHLLTNVVNSKVDLGKIDFSKDSNTNAIKIVNAVSNGMQALGNTSIKKGNYKVTFNIYANMWSAFAGSVKAEKVSGLNSGTTYIGEVDSTMAGTQKVLTIYMDCMSDIVKDACKYALFSILSELKSVTYIAEFEQKELEDFFANKVNILQKKGYGNVLALFLNVRAGYKVIKPFLIAKDTGSLSIVLNNAQSMYNTISEMSFSEKGINKKAVKEAVKTVEKARKKLANKLYNYIYNTNEPVEEEGFVGWLKNVFGIKCPVEFEIYDVSGDLIGYVDSSEKHEDYVWYTDDIYIELSGDSKFVYAPIDMELIFRFNAIDDGVMNYTIERQDGEERIDRLNYFDVPLSSGDTFEQCIPANTNLKAVKNLPLIGDSEINYDSYLDSDDLTGHINVTCEAENGLVIGEGPYPIGDLVTLTAIKDYDDYTFKGWFVDNTIVETSEIYRFTAKEDVSVKAVFEKKIDIDYSYTAEYADDYAESFCEVIKQQNNTCGVHIALPADKMNEVLSPKINLYNNSDELISSETYNAEATSENDILISGLVLDDIYRISVFDSNNELVATIIRNDSLLPQQIIPDKDELTLKVKDTAQISVLPMPVKSILSDVRWESLNPEIAQVDENGVVTGLHTGKTTVRCVMLNSEINCESEVTVYAETGDVDLDGHITISDVTAIQRYLAEFEPFSDEQLALADTNGDGEINITDATHLQLYLAEYDVVLGKS